MHDRHRRATIACLASAALAATAAADPETFSDAFDDFSRTRTWTHVTVPDVVEPIEDRGRLGFNGRPNHDEDAFAGYVGEGWRFDAGQPFRFTVDLSFVVGRVRTDGEIGLVVGLYEDADVAAGTVTDGVELRFGRDAEGLYRSAERTSGGGVVDRVEADAGRRLRGTLYVEYDGAGTLCASMEGFGPGQADVLCLSSVLGDSTGTATVLLGAYSDGPRHRLASGRAWFDDFEIAQGTILEDFYVLPDTDANGDGVVDEIDLATRFVDGSMTTELLVATLEDLGHASADYPSAVAWRSAMNRLWRDVRRAYPEPRHRRLQILDRRAMWAAYDPDAVPIPEAATALGDSMVFWMEVGNGGCTEDVEGDGEPDVSFAGTRTFDLFVQFSQPNEVNVVGSGPGALADEMELSDAPVQHPLGSNRPPDASLFASFPCLEYDTHFAIGDGMLYFVPNHEPDPADWGTSIASVWYTMDPIFAQMDVSTFGDEDFYVRLLRVTVPAGTQIHGEISVGVTLFGTGMPWVFDGLDVPDFPAPPDS